MRSNDCGRKHRIVGSAELDRDIVEPLALHALAERDRASRHDVLGQHPAPRPTTGARRTV